MNIKTYEEILAEMLEKLPPDLDKSEGGLIFDAMAPAAMAIAECYTDLEFMSRMCSAETAVGEYLDRKCEEIGIWRKPAMPAVVKARLTGSSGEPLVLDGGAEFILSGTGIAFASGERIESGMYVLTASSAGQNHSIFAGPLVPRGSVSGFFSGSITEIVTSGSDAESDSSLRTRYYERLSRPLAYGNAQYYKNLAEGYDGVGRAKIIPKKYGALSVAILPLTEELTLPDTKLLESLQEYMDPASEGGGMGAAPVGAKIYIEAPVRKNLSVSLWAKAPDDEALREGIFNEIKSAVSSYFRDVSLARSLVNPYEIAAAILSLGSLDAIGDVMISGSTSGIMLAENEIPYLVSTYVDFV